MPLLLRATCNWVLSAVLLIVCGSSLADQSNPPPSNPSERSPTFCSLPNAAFSFRGILGERIDRNLNQWLLRAPESNPGMIQMFRMRDRKPVPELVPWAGEFAGKYLISAVQALRLTQSDELRSLVKGFVKELLSTQAEDGYLGPFPRTDRLRGNWDLWGHYHILEGLLLWYEMTGDPDALFACRRIADLVCRTYLDQPQRVFDAGSHEMNMAIIHGLALLYRECPEERYLLMIREIEKDWERAGDYLRTGLEGVDFFATPRPRWESLHDLQGLAELWRITGDRKYRESFAHHWRSIARWDIRNSGAFSGGEQATGNSYSPSPIETCCTIAWMALSVDMLRLSGDPLVADHLELSTLNGALGAQHPSGSWWTYSTPMDGAREASAHSIVFQARAGTPELNCCSVNGPRALGMLGDWAIMQSERGVVINWHGPATYTIPLPQKGKLGLTCDSNYPLDGKVQWSVRDVRQPSRFSILFRVPAWASDTAVLLNGRPLPNVKPGQYFECDRVWRKGDRVELNLDLGLRTVSGDREAAGMVSVYRGPILLAFDQGLNGFDATGVPALTPDVIKHAKVVPPAGKTGGLFPWLIMELPSNPALRLCDFASAGATGTRYRSWLPALQPLPPPPITRRPVDGGTLAPGTTPFRWTTRTNSVLNHYRLQVGESPDFSDCVLDFQNLQAPRFNLERKDQERLSPQRWYYWRVTAVGPHGETVSAQPPARFRLDPSKPELPFRNDPPLGPEALAVRASLSGNLEPEFGQLLRPTTFETTPGPHGGPAVQVNGQNQMLMYQLPEAFESDYSVAVWFKVLTFPEGRLGQVFSCWTAGMDDPLRLTIDRGQLAARLEAQQGYSTKGAAIETGKWYHVTAVKSGSRLALFVNGKLKEEVQVPLLPSTRASNCALGGNPNYSGNEHLRAAFSGFAFWFRALDPQEIRDLAHPPVSE